MNNTKVEMYKALRTVKQSIDRQELVISKSEDLKQFFFMISRLINALDIANQDPELQNIKHRLDQSQGEL